MNAVAECLAAGPSHAGGTAAPRCFHCGADCEATGATSMLDGQSQTFCCSGCAAAAHWILANGLASYYELRTEPGTAAAAEGADFTAWDRESLLAEHVRMTAQGREITVLTDGMRCAACAWLIDRALASAPGVIEASANSVTGRIRIAWDPERIGLSALLRRLGSLGYVPYLADGTLGEAARLRERRRWLLRTGVAGIASLQAMMFAEALYLDANGTMPLATRDFLRWVGLLVSTPVVFYCGWPFLHGAWQSLRLHRFGMDSLIAVSVLLAWSTSLSETLRGGPQVWFDTAVMFVFLLLLARLLEERMRARARARIDALARARPAMATRCLEDGRCESVPVRALRPGDRCLVPAGMAVPSDGVLCDAAAAFSQSLLTGESVPIRKQPGDEVLAGSICADQAVTFRVTRVAGETRLSQLSQLVETALSQRPRLATLADRYASRFVAVLFICATLCYLAWRAYAPERAFEVTLALLMISCPCALSLAVPLALTAANSALLRFGALVVRGDAHEILARATDVILDKTGTLTTGSAMPRMTWIADSMTLGEARGLAAALAAHSAHPVAASLRASMTAHPQAQAGPLPPLEDLREFAGLGISGRCAGRELRLGRRDFATGESGEDAHTWLGDGHAALARFELADDLRPDAHAMVDGLRALGLRLHLFSGDGTAAVESCAQELQIQDCQARLSPEDKLSRIRALQRQGRVVVMIGDGINDGPVLAGADTSIALASGATLAQRAAAVVWTRSSLAELPALFIVARRCQRVVIGNFRWAVLYNLVALPLAASGLVTPWMAAIAMVASSLTVTLNARRLAAEPAP